MYILQLRTNVVADLYDKWKFPQAVSQSIKIKYDIVKLSLKEAMPTKTSTTVTDPKYSSIIWGEKSGKQTLRASDYAFYQTKDCTDLIHSFSKYVSNTAASEVLF